MNRKKAGRPVGSGGRPVHLHTLGDSDWRSLVEVARLHGSTPANVGVAFNSGMSKIAEEVLLLMTGEVPDPGAVRRLSRSEEFGLAVAEIMSGKGRE